jgi:PAS domain S-box-containing protein
MEVSDTLARPTLDTLPVNVAVVDADGTILLTNRAWREFAGVGSGTGDMVGRNYFEAVDAEGDDYARQAVEGLRAVIDEERELFTLEYPCHTPSEQQWFLMRATPLPPESEGAVVVAHIDITARKLAELRTREQRAELEHLVSRLQGLVGDVLEAVLQAASRTAIEETVCQRLVSVEPYAVAWVGHVDHTTDVVVPETSAASAGTDVADWTDPGDLSVPLDGDDPVARAVATGEAQSVTDRAGASLAAVHEAAHASAGTVVAFPLRYGDAEYGVLVVYAPDPGAVTEHERAVLEVVARAASTAINAVEGRRLLAADRVVELELELDDPGPFFRDVSADLDCELTYESSLYLEDGTARMLFVLRDGDPDAVAAAVADRAEIRRVTHVSDGAGGSVLEFEVDRPPIVDALAERGAEVTAMTAAGGTVSVTAELPAGADVRAVVDALADRYPSTAMRARRERDRQQRTRQELLADLEERLTARQRLALQKAFLGGFFDWPREVSGEELAASMDISPSTYHQHLRAAERKVVEELFE